MSEHEVDTTAHRSSYPMGNKHHGTPERPDWGTFCVECKDSWPCDVSLLAARLADAEARAEAAEAEAANAEADYERRGERLWRLAAKAGWTPLPGDNDATAELFIAAVLDREALRGDQ